MWWTAMLDCGVTLETAPPTPQLGPQVDLHGMSVLEARAAVLCVLSMLQQQFRDVGAIAHDVTFITGRGAGSEGGEPVLRREVAALLQRLHLRLPEEGPTDNPGRIVIPRQAGASGGSMLLLTTSGKAVLVVGRADVFSSCPCLTPYPPGQPQVVCDALRQRMALQRQRQASAETSSSSMDGGSAAPSSSSSSLQGDGASAAGGAGLQ